jgi:hypothetical protein
MLQISIHQLHGKPSAHRFDRQREIVGRPKELLVCCNTTAGTGVVTEIEDTEAEAAPPSFLSICTF